MLAFVPAQPEPPTPRSLRAYLAERLPDFAVPRYIRVLAVLPTSLTHKLDKAALVRDGVTVDADDAQLDGAAAGAGAGLTRATA